MASNPLPTAPNLEYYRKQAKALLKSLHSGDLDSLSRVRKIHPKASPPNFQLADALLVVARENGSPSWPRFKQMVETAAADSASPNPPPEVPAAPHTASRNYANIGDDAVRAKTGKGWNDWFAIFDAAGGVTKTHKEIVAIAREHGVGPWWQQMVTVSYEQARGLRGKNMSCAGDYQVSASKTINAPAERIFDAWNDPAIREQWLPGARMTIRKATSPKNLRVTWHEGGNLDIGIYPKGDSRAQCTADHNKLSRPEDVERLRAYWSAALNCLKELLEA